jgi:hypothetical protein
MVGALGDVAVRCLLTKYPLMGEIAGDESRIEEWLGSELRAAIGSDVEVEWVAESANDGDSGIVAVHVLTPSGVMRLYLFMKRIIKLAVYKNYWQDLEILLSTKAN